MSARCRVGLVAAIAWSVASAGSLAASPPVTAATSGHAPTTPIHHFIVLMQENHTFDNYFGTYPGAEGIPKGVCMPVDAAKGPTPCVRPFNIGPRAIADLEHDQQAAVAAYDNGKMDDFVGVQDAEHEPGALSMGYYTGSAIPFSWNAAKNYVLFDHFFSSALDASLLNHVYWVAAGPANAGSSTKAVIGPNGIVTKTIFDELQTAGVSWKFYIQHYDPSVTYWTSSSFGTHDENQTVWCPLLDIRRFVDDKKLASHIVNLSQYYVDARDGTLPNVSYIIPSGDSEHPPGNLLAGQRFQRGLASALMQSSAWSSSAFLVSYDDWGGWYDSLVPPKRDEHGDGFRVAAYMISPYARRGYIDDTNLDFTSDLKFIEQNWRVPPLTRLDATAGSLMGAFDFAKPPRPPQIISLKYPPVAPSKASAQEAILFVGYGGALLIVFVLGVWVFWARQPRRRLRRSDWGAGAGKGSDR